MKHTICHIEWSSTDLERTKKFLSGLFEWEFEYWGENYLLFSPPEGVGGGIAQVENVNPGDSPLIHVEVDEIEPYLEKAKQLGGCVAAPKTEIPTVGWYAVLTDPDGNLVGLFQGIKEE
ncbi:MAG: VOC family protein [Theionarchaea archaeon]|nr:VOC family protein [Theionarchaea archaeon]MBU7036670.1 VOC family protein [Theionarchaea archaeon]